MSNEMKAERERVRSAANRAKAASLRADREQLQVAREGLQSMGMSLDSSSLELAEALGRQAVGLTWLATVVASGVRDSGVDELSALKRTHDAQVIALTQAATNAEQGRRDAEHARAAITAQLNTTHVELEGLVSELAALRVRVDSLTVQRDEALTASRQLGDELAEAHGTVDELRISLGAASSEVRRVSADRNDLHRRLEILGTSERVLREESAGLRHELGQVAARGAAADEVARLRGELRQRGIPDLGGLVIARR